MDEVKLCCDCKHFLPIPESCAKSPKPTDFVHGAPTGFYQAQAERETTEGCGPQARWFKPRQP